MKPIPCPFLCSRSSGTAVQRALLLGLTLSAAANAQVFSFNFTGTMAGIVDPGTFLPDEFQSGQAVLGTITYDLSNVTDFAPADPEY